MNEEAKLMDLREEHQSRKSQRGAARHFLDDANIHIADFPDKVKPRQFLRDAAMSHIRRLTGLTSFGAETILDEWIEDQQ